MNVRQYYLDNIRWSTVILVLIYHVCYIFNGVGIPGGIPGAKNIPVFDMIACIVYPWFMVLLFIIAGMSARYALQLGYYIFSHEKVQEIVEKICIPMLCFAVIGAIVYAIRYAGSDYTSSACLQSIMTNLYLWIVVLAVIGCGKRYWNRETSFTQYMTKSSFGVYILHYPILMVVCYLLHNQFDFPTIWNYVIALILEIAMTFVMYEVIKQIPIIRYFTLGIKVKKT